MSPDYQLVLDNGVRMHVRWTLHGPHVVSYSVVLTVDTPTGPQTVRIWDAAHGHNEMHRYTRTTGKLPAEAFHPGSLAEGFTASYRHCRRHYADIITAWTSS